MRSFGLAILLLFCAINFGSAEIKDKGWWKNTIFYQIFPRSFLDSDADGKGDFKGIIQKINESYFNNLGVGALILTPIYESPLFNTGHDVSDHKNLDDDFGTMQDFEELINSAHNKSLKVILDFVPNHTSKKHSWFIKSLAGSGKYKNYYIWQDGKKAGEKHAPPSNWLSVFNKPAWDLEKVTEKVPGPEEPKQKEKYYLHQFSSEEPDLNLENKEVLLEMEDILRYWLDKNVDGFRLNAIDHIFEQKFEENEKEKPKTKADLKYDDLDHTLTKDDQRNYNLTRTWREFLDNHTDFHNLSEKVLITEANTNRENTIKYLEYGSNIPLNFDLLSNLKDDSTAKNFQDAINEWLNKTNNSPNWMLGNHDKSRLATRYKDRSDQMTMLAMLLPGNVITYYGVEIGMEDGKTRNDNPSKTDKKENGETEDPKADEKKEIYVRDAFRTPFQWNDADEMAGFSKNTQTWLKVNPNYKEINLEKQKTVANSHYNIYLELVKLRSIPIVQNGTTNVELLVEKDEKEGQVLSVSRQHGEESVVLLLNFSKDNKTVSVGKYVRGSDTATVKLSSTSFTQAPWGKTVPTGQVQLPGKAAVVLTLKNGAGFLIASFNLVLATSLFILFKLH